MKDERCKIVALPPNDDPSEAALQSFQVARAPKDALRAAKRYLQAAGDVAPGLKGELIDDQEGLVIHHGRIRTRVNVAKDPQGSAVSVERVGTVPLAETRTWIFIAGIVGFVLAWALAWYNSGGGGLSPLVTISFFFLGMTALVAVLYVVDRSLEHRGVSLCRSLEDAMRGDPMQVVHREIDALERTSSIANAVLFYCASLIVEFFIYVILLSDGIREGIDEAVALETMRAGFAIPLLPAILFGLGWFWYTNRVHRDRFAAMDA